VTADQVRAARAEGHQAGFTRVPASPNPYAPEHVPVWQQRTRRDPRDQLLARAWSAGYTTGQAAYAAEHGLSLVNG
jgi:hypothetical protein